MAIPAPTEWPTAVSPLLADIVAAIRDRSKSLKHRVAKFDIEIVTDPDVDVGKEFERLNLRLQNWSPNPDRLSFAFWDDGAMWLDGRRSAKTGWKYEFSFHANISDVDPETVRDMIEDSLWISDRTQMEMIWSCRKPITQ